MFSQTFLIRKTEREISSATLRLGSVFSFSRKLHVFDSKMEEDECM